MKAVIPARLSAAELAGTISRPIDQVLAALASRGEPDSPEDILGAELAIDIARGLGFQLTVEPRDLALERLYEYEATGEAVTDIGGRAGALIDGVVSSLDELDEMIESVSEHWSVARMPLIDRNILRIALHELRHDETIPTAVIVSEAVRLAQNYSTEKSSAFVNGVLSTLARTIRGG